MTHRTRLTLQNDFGGIDYIGFEEFTLVPFETNLIDYDLLSPDQVNVIFYIINQEYRTPIWWFNWPLLNTLPLSPEDIYIGHIPKLLCDLKPPDSLQRVWLNRYHARCKQEIGEAILKTRGSTKAYEWLVARTAPIAEDPNYPTAGVAEIRFGFLLMVLLTAVSAVASL